MREAHISSLPRDIIACNAIGAACGFTIQRSDLTSRRITVENPTLLVVVEGSKQVGWSGGVCKAGEGDALTIEAGEVVDIRSTPGANRQHRSMWISWDKAVVEKLHKPVARVHPAVVMHGPVETPFRDSFFRAFDALHHRGSLPVAIARNRVEEVVLWLAERNFQFSRVSKERTVAHHLRRAIAGNPAADWSMDDVAQAMAMSVATLRRRLNDEKVGFREMLHDVRMTHALNLLQNTDTSILGIAMAVGYDSSSRFAHRFRARFGFLPSDVRYGRV